MIVLAVVTAPEAVKGRLTPPEGWIGWEGGFSNLYLGTELRRLGTRETT